MVDDLCACPDDPPGAPQRVPPATLDAGALRRLPTLQRNALRKIFDRPEFTPAEVAALGYRRLQQAEGIGQKGLQVIAAWLQGCGCELKPPEAAAGVSVRQKGSRRNIEQAVRLLRTHGYLIRLAGDDPGT
ncbi:hypothetical protein [Dechloromonas sp. H13]|uniref:hypothetical protein n=1 Tax=Dechloromonas sp. H13 TaxID=2570193 RepID=UPI0012914FED|nr:hypothetical protein [Dechloromonas sp. H13]